MLVLLLRRRRRRQSPPSLLGVGSRLPAVQRLSSCADSSGGFGIDNNSSSIPGRSAGIVSLAFIPPPQPSTSEASCFNFAALRSNGIVETWRGTRRGKEQNNNDYSEASPASYVKGDSLINGVVGRTTDGGDKTPETSPDHDVSSSSGGWYINRPITPIGMVSSYSISDGVSWNNKNLIL